MSLRIYNDKTPVVLEDKVRVDVCKKISDLYFLLEFLNQTVQDDKLDNNAIHTTMGLYESYYRELSKILGYDTILEKEHIERTSIMKEKNKEILDLKSKLGKEVSPEAVSGAIKLYSDIFTAWYGNEGFHYASIKMNPKETK